MTGNFYKFPKHWLTDEPFCTVGIKPLAILMIANDLVDWSIKNNWIENGRVFVRLSNATINEHLGFANATIISCKKKLQEAGLIYIPKNGKGHADKWFLDVQKLNYSSSEIELEQFKNDTTDAARVVQKLNESSSKIDTNQFNFDAKVVQKLNTNKTINKTNNKTNYQDYLSDLENNKDLVNTYQSIFGYGGWTDIVSQSVFRAVNDFGKDLVIYALEQSREQRPRTFRYVEKILTNWKNEGLHTVEQVKQSKEQKRSQFQPAQQKPTIPDWTDPDYKNETSESERLKLEEIKRQTLERLRKEG